MKSIALEKLLCTHMKMSTAALFEIAKKWEMNMANDKHVCKVIVGVNWHWVFGEDFLRK